jgi:Protein of unknown function (DUF2778)
MNDPKSQGIKDHGPLPQGLYHIDPLMMPHDPECPHLGPSMKLTPDPNNDMLDRDGFYIHLRNPLKPLDSSDGCIVCEDYAHIQCLEHWRSQGEDQVTVTA